jgi:hypothetical protein
MVTEHHVMGILEQQARSNIIVNLRITNIIKSAAKALRPFLSADPKHFRKQFAQVCIVVFIFKAKKIG